MFHNPLYLLEYFSREIHVSKNEHGTSISFFCYLWIQFYCFIHVNFYINLFFMINPKLHYLIIVSWLSCIFEKFIGFFIVSHIITSILICLSPISLLHYHAWGLQPIGNNSLPQTNPVKLHFLSFSYCNWSWNCVSPYSLMSWILLSSIHG